MLCELRSTFGTELCAGIGYLRTARGAFRHFKRELELSPAFLTVLGRTWNLGTTVTTEFGTLLSLVIGIARFDT
jgi:hypothetical protein